jgi:hypothetical protein
MKRSIFSIFAVVCFCVGTTNATNGLLISKFLEIQF